MERPFEELFIVVVASAFFLLMAIGVIVLFQIYSRRQLKILLERKELESKFQEELLMTRIESQEYTMDHISKELHDNIGQLLSSCKLLIGISRRAMPESMDTMVEADETLAQAIQELRAISKSLNKEWLSKFDLIENLKAEVNRINTLGAFNASAVYPNQIRLQIEKQLILFRVIQESMQNAIKHGNCTQLSITIKEDSNGLVISIADNGNGFNPEDSNKHGVGIINIKQRVTMLAGTVKWSSSAEAGTTIIIKLPI